MNTNRKFGVNGVLERLSTSISSTFIGVACIALVSMRANAAAIQTTEESRALIDDLVINIQQTLVAVAESEKKAGNKLDKLNIEVSLPADHSSNLGLVLEPSDKNGLKVLSISPGGSAESLGIQPGDAILSVNQLNLSEKGSKGLLTALQTLKSGDNISLQINRAGLINDVSGVVTGSYRPAFQLIVGDKHSNNTKENKSSECGILSVFNTPPETRRLYSGVITHINGEKVLSSREIYRLAPGKYSVQMIEAIDDPSLDRGAIVRVKPKSFDVTVKANTKYHLGVEFISNRRLRPSTNEYWQPVVWETIENTKCTL
jgi:hypothetical protein